MNQRPEIEPIELFLEEQRSRAQRGLVVPTRATLEALDDVTQQRQNVYFVRCAGTDGPIKIGCAVDVVDRICVLQVGCPWELTLLGSIRGGRRAEGALHQAFRGFHIRGEWFMAPKEVRRAIRHLLGIDEQGRHR